MSNKLVVAAAGSGKTSLLIKKAFNKPNEKTLITTYTDANIENIRSKFINEIGYIPANVTIQPWFSFLIANGVKPYQNSIGLSDFECKGLHLVQGQSTCYIKKTNLLQYCFDSEHQIYSDKLSYLVIEENARSGEAVVRRLSKMYNNIYIDEIQDLSGYDLELLKLLFAADMNCLLVGDPRQGTYSTNNTQKNKRYSRSSILDFFEGLPKDTLIIDKTTLQTNYRCSSDEICKLSDSLYPEFPMTKPGNKNISDHEGIFRIRPDEVNHYMDTYRPLQLRYNKKTQVSGNYQVLTFGKSKGLEEDHVIIYPTLDMKKWLDHKKIKLPGTTRALFYVAITRAKHSVAFVI